MFIVDDDYVVNERLQQEKYLCPCDDKNNYLQDVDYEDDNDSMMTEMNRYLQENSNGTSAPSLAPPPTGGETWEIVYTCVVLLFMFVALISDRIGADHVMMTALTLYMAAGIITVEEGLVGFSNEGLISVLVLFVVAAGISATGALDWYMGKLLGRPKTIAGAQLRLMTPIAIISAFLNNTPVVQVMIPILQRWGKNIGVSPQQLLIPLSFASILGGTCTLIGTSTNLVVAGLLNDRYGDLYTIGLFDLGEYGVPVAFAGITYILVASPCLLPGIEKNKGGTGGGDGAITLDDSEEILLGARITAWSPAAGRSVKRSGLRDTGGLYLVSVLRTETNNVHRAVGQEFILNVGDIVYFTGLVEGFGQFCENHGLEVVTNEVQDTNNQHCGTTTANSASDNNNNNSNSNNVSGSIAIKNGDDDDQTEGANNKQQKDEDGMEQKEDSGGGGSALAVPSLIVTGKLSTLAEESPSYSNIDDVGLSLESLLQADDKERRRVIFAMTDIIRDVTHGKYATRNWDTDDEHNNDNNITIRRSIVSSSSMRRSAIVPKKLRTSTNSNNNAATANNIVGPSIYDPPRIVIAEETIDNTHLVVVGVSAKDRQGLLLDISKVMSRLKLQLHHTEAAVVEERSVSIWRCECMSEDDIIDIEDIWSVLNALLEPDAGIEAVKRRGLRVVRAVITKPSRLVGRTALEVNFRQLYKAAIVAVQKGGKSIHQSLATVRFDVGDVLILQTNDDSPLLQTPPPNYYKDLNKEITQVGKSSAYFSNISKGIKTSSGNIRKMIRSRSSDSMRRDDESSTDRSQTERSQTSANDVEEGFFIEGTPLDNDNEENDDDPFSGPKSIEQLDVDDQEKPKLVEPAWRDLQVLFDDNVDDSLRDFSVGREFLTAMRVAPKSQLSNKTVAQAEINKLPGVYLVSIERPIENIPDDDEQSERMRIKNIVSKIRGESSSAAENNADDGTMDGTAADPKFIAISPDTPLKDDDVLWFSGSASAVGDLRKIPGLVSFERSEVKKIKENIHDRRLVQAVVAKQGPLVGKTVVDVRFRTRYGAAVIAIHREGKRIHEHPGQVKLHAGDVLLLEAGPTFIKRSAESDNSFALLSEVENSRPPRMRLLIPSLIIAVAMLAAFTAGVASLLVCALVASIFMVVLGILSQQEVRDAINWEIFVVIAAAFGIGQALVNSGVAGAIADFLVKVGEAVGMGDAGLYGAVYFGTFLISNVVTNNAAAALFFPIAMDAAEQTGASVILMAYTLMLGASASFMSPFGYTTNLLIYGPGGYKYKDFLWFGTPMQLFLWVLTVLFLAVPRDLWYVSWVGTSVLLFVVALIKIGGGLFSQMWRKSESKNA